MDGHCDKGSENYANIGMKGFVLDRCTYERIIGFRCLVPRGEFREFVPPSSILESGREGEGGWDQRILDAI